MVSKVYTPEEVAEILRITVEEVVKAIESGEIPAFHLLGKWRITEDALLKVMASTPGPRIPSHPASRPSGRLQPPNTSPPDVRQAGVWVWLRLKEVAPDLRPSTPSKDFSANGNQGILSVATIDNPNRPGDYFFGFPCHLLQTGKPAYLVPVIAPRQGSDPVAFVIPYDKHKQAVDGWAIAKSNQKKYHILAQSGSYYLTGRGMQPLDLANYRNAFHLLR